ncbi:Gfo/Idh/MocA family oxidoreductase [Chloroflexi bacterium TSY]|nr:Gfo/Idh/MocA family oxidoreductase [Chloroflexi bacterium TSY]MBV7329601.1 Gfo/Idh/MocA family oxidoreductase [Chloroflexi bacterium TSY]
MYRAAVIGLGRMGSTFDDEMTQGGSIFVPYAHAPSYVASPLVELVAGADPHDEQRTIFGDRWGISTNHLYADYQEMLANEQPDIVSVCTTARIRAQIVQDLAQAGVKAIWAEKPLALTLAEADAMVQTCREHGVMMAVNCARRWNPYFVETQRMIETGELGELLQITAYCQCGLSHNGSHLIDAIRYLVGDEIRWVWGEMESDEAAESDDDLMGNGYLAFDNGVRAYLRGMPTGVANWEFDILGTEGRVRLIDSCLEVEKTVRVPGGPRNRGLPAKVPFPLPTNIPGMGLTIVEDLVHAIETGQPPRCSGEDGRAALEVAMALRESHRRGGIKVTLPLDDRSLRILSTEIKHDEVPARIRRLRQN